MTAMPRTRSNFPKTGDGCSISLNPERRSPTRPVGEWPPARRAVSETGAPFRGTRRAPVLGTLSLRERLRVRVNAAWRFKATLLQTAKPTWKPPIRSSRRAPAATSSPSLLARPAFICVLLTLLQLFAHAAEADLILRGGKVVTVDERFSIHEAIAVEGARI